MNFTKQPCRQRRRALAALHSGEEGLFTLLQCFAAAFFAGLCLMLLNTGEALTNKMEGQNAADACARSAAVWMARGLNAISAINHIAGEHVGKLAVHEALIGHASAPSIGDDHSQSGEGVPFASGALGAAQAELQRQLAALHQCRSGQPMDAEHATLVSQEQRIEAELEYLRSLASLHADLGEAHNRLGRTVLPQLQQSADDVVQLTPSLAAESAKAVAIDSGWQIAHFGAKLPVDPDPCLTDIAISQLARASYPWALHYAQSVHNSLSEHCPLSGAAQIFAKELKLATRRLCHEFTSERVFIPYVLSDTNLANKGRELWTDDPAQADRHFAVLCVLSSASSGNSIPPRLTYAQAIAYNANAQQPAAQVGAPLSSPTTSPLQPIAGWDTLQWDTDALPPPPELTPQAGLAHLPGKQPRIHLNWQAKLVPVSTAKLRLLENSNKLLAERLCIDRATLPLHLTH